MTVEISDPLGWDIKASSAEVRRLDLPFQLAVLAVQTLCGPGTRRWVFYLSKLLPARGALNSSKLLVSDIGSSPIVVRCGTNRVDLSDKVLTRTVYP